jgi:DDE superfamily endonuclease
MWGPLDNCGGQNMTAALIRELSAKNVELRFLPPNATHLCQPAESFVISKIKDAWTKRWELHMKMIHDVNWANNIRKDGAWSGKIMNPGKEFFLGLTADAVGDVNAMRDENGLKYSLKAMIRCGLAKDVTGVWHEKQLSRELQLKINKHRKYFLGSPVPKPGEKDS